MCPKIRMPPNLMPPSTVTSLKTEKSDPDNETMDNPSSSSSIRSAFNVEDEYNANLRTQSYTDLYTMAHPSRTPASNNGKTTEQKRSPIQSPRHKSSHLSPAPSGFFKTLPQFMLSPSQDLLGGLKMSSILEEFFETTMDACVACGVLLASLDKARRQHRCIRILLIRLTKVAMGKLHDRPGEIAFGELEKRLDVDNPLSSQNLSLFHTAHSRYHPLVLRLAAAHRRILRQARFLQAAHKIFLLITFTCVFRKIRPKKPKRPNNYSEVAVQMDMAVKGAYIVARDFDTISRLVRRAHDEIEHGRDVVRMAVAERRRQLLREVAREVAEGEEEFMGKLEELEEHVYLCMITINRSRRLVAQEIVGKKTMI